MMTNAPTSLPAPAHGPAFADDQDLLRRAAADDAEAFEALFRRHYDGLRGFLYRRLRSHEEAEDAVTLTFYNAWRARSSFHGAGVGMASGKAWLYQIATRVALDMLRRRQRRPELELDALEPDLLAAARPEVPDPVTLALEREHAASASRAVNGAVSRLSEEERCLVRLFYFEERSYDEISRLLGVSRSQVRGRLHRLRRRLYHDLVARQQWQPA
jgi:RNA polymerase sigma-70 factor, ECF subfamily